MNIREEEEWVSVLREEVEEAAKNGNHSAVQALKKASYYDEEYYNVMFLRGAGHAGERYRVRTEKVVLHD